MKTLEELFQKDLYTFNRDKTHITPEEEHMYYLGAVRLMNEIKHSKYYSKELQEGLIAMITYRLKS